MITEQTTRKPKVLVLPPEVKSEEAYKESGNLVNFAGERRERSIAAALDAAIQSRPQVSSQSRGNRLLAMLAHLVLAADEWPSREGMIARQRNQQARLRVKYYRYLLH